MSSDNRYRVQCNYNNPMKYGKVWLIILSLCNLLDTNFLEYLLEVRNL